MASEYYTPDVRFGMSFLDEKYQSKAVNGEVVIDKVDAELFLKRPIDGRLISFMRRNSNLYDTVNELNTEIQSNQTFIYPEDSTNDLYSSLYFDFFKICGDVDYNILLQKNIDLTGKSEAGNPNLEIHFKVSTNSNGFFLKLKSRENDRKVLSFLNSEFNTKYSTALNNSLEDYIYTSASYWEYGNASVILRYEITGLDSNNEVKTITSTAIINVRINENRLIQIPNLFIQDGKMCYGPSHTVKLHDLIKTDVYITKLSFPKLNYMRNNVYVSEKLSPTDPMYDAAYAAVIEADGAAFIKTIEVSDFINGIQDIPATNANMFVNQIIDIGFMYTYMNRIRKVNGGNGIILSEKRPSELVWTVNNVWAEIIRTVLQGNIQHPNLNDGATTMEDLEDFLFGIRYINTEFTTIPENKEGLLIEDDMHLEVEDEHGAITVILKNPYTTEYGTIDALNVAEKETEKYANWGK